MRYVRWIVSLIVILLLILAARHVQWRLAFDTIKRASLLWIAIAIALNGTSLTLRGVRWWIFLRPVGATSLSLAIRGAVVGAGFNNLLVANGGDAARALLVARESRVPRTSVLATLALERSFDPLCFALLLFIATFVVPLPTAFAGARIGVGIALVIAGAVLLLLIRAPKHEVIVNAESTLSWREHLRTFRNRVAWLSTGPRFVNALACSIALWLLQLGEYAAVARALCIALPFVGSVAAMILINAGLVVRATPGGVGYFQFAYALAVSPFGVATETALATALLIQVVEIVPVTLAALAVAPRMNNHDERAQRSWRRTYVRS